MKYLPFERITYRTNLSEQEVITRLLDFVEPKKFGFGRNPVKEYEGFINNNYFEINRIIKGRNSFLPQISGVIQKHHYETQIEVKMKLHWLVFVFLIFWCGFVVLFLISTLIMEDLKSLNFFLPIFMLIFAYLLTMYGFKSESKKSKEDLIRIFEARIQK